MKNIVASTFICKTSVDKHNSLLKTHTVSVSLFDLQTKQHWWKAGTASGWKDRGAISHPGARANERPRHEVTHAELLTRSEFD